MIFPHSNLEKTLVMVAFPSEDSAEHTAVLTHNFLKSGFRRAEVFTQKRFCALRLYGQVSGVSFHNVYLPLIFSPIPLGGGGCFW